MVRKEVLRDEKHSLFWLCPLSDVTQAINSLSSCSYSFSGATSTIREASTLCSALTHHWAVRNAWDALQGCSL